MPYQELVSAKYLKEEESAVLAPEAPPENRDASDDVRYARTLILVAIFAVAAVAWFMLLPYIQAILIPTAAGGVAGPWIVRPNHATHLFACLCLAGITTPLVGFRLRKRWKEQDAIAGRKMPFADQTLLKVVIYILTFKYLLICGAQLVLYLFSWYAITNGGIEVRKPWDAGSYSFAQVRALRLEPRGISAASPSDKYDYAVEFTDGHSWTFNLSNEGLTDSELSAIAKYISKQSGKEWRIVPVSNGRGR